jgi:Cof subfamily protein (haloacid dehalogenase superfamily)
MTNSIRMIATDLDGTLLRHDGTVSERTKAAFRAAAAAGYTLVLASGRPPRSVLPIAEQLGVDGLAVCSNGAIVYDLGRSTVLHNEAVPRAALAAIIDAVRAREPSVCFATEHGHRIGHEAAFPFVGASTPANPPLVGDVHALCAEDVVKLAIHHPEQAVETLAALVRACAGERVSVTFSTRHFVEVAAAGVSKALGLARVCERLRIEPAAVIAFGDMPNDLAMLAFAGRGVAVANAHPDVLAEGYEVTASNDEDGVAQVVEQLLARPVARNAICA